MTKWGIAIALAGALLITGCSGRDSTPTNAAASSTAAHASGTPSDALRALLTAEQNGDHAASFALLSSAGRVTYADVDDWSRLRSQQPAVTGFTISSTKGANVVAIVEHEPGLDPFVGLSPARTSETWTARAEGGAWRLDPEPTVKALLPRRTAAVPAALAWARSVQSCNETQTMSLQAVATVFGRSDGADALCGAKGAVDAEPVELPAGPATADLVSQYTTDALSWATAVHIGGVPVPFSVVLAPIGDSWKVVSVFDR